MQHLRHPFGRCFPWGSADERCTRCGVRGSERSIYRGDWGRIGGSGRVADVRRCPFPLGSHSSPGRGGGHPAAPPPARRLATSPNSGGGCSSLGSVPAWHSPVTESPRRWTSRFSSGEFLRSGARTARPGWDRGRHHSPAGAVADVRRRPLPLVASRPPPILGEVVHHSGPVPAWHSPVTESPRRWTSPFSSGEFIRSGRADGTSNQRRPLPFLRAWRARRRLRSRMAFEFWLC